ncbi:MAG TPA: pseudouridine-5'-phosphate glycosidase [Saprospiraceae bacterium]|nr:pseudouridine-5'-phosphate glycosidase [Saprospiraceae bacterium]
MNNKMLPYLEIHPEVMAAIQNRRPVVALESTLIAHGLPYPDNLKTATLLEEAVRQNGAIPATIAIIKGKLKIGLSKSEVEFLAQSGDITKCNKREIPVLLSVKKSGATTVSATMFLSSLSGIQFFATGGIGGVHIGGASSLDISSDLQELAQTNVAVVSAGAKSILDIGLTLEYLETQGVPVLGYRSEHFPSFYRRESGFKVNHSFDDIDELVKTIQIKWNLGLKGGVLVCNPIPKAFELKYKSNQTAIESALIEAETMKIGGKELTPFLLERIHQLTRGASVTSNIELVRNNAALAAKMAVIYTDTDG